MPVFHRYWNRCIDTVSRRALIFLTCAVWIVVGFSPCGTPALAQETIVGWHNNLETALEAAHKSRKPIFLVFRCVR